MVNGFSSVSTDFYFSSVNLFFPNESSTTELNFLNFSEFVMRVQITCSDHMHGEFRLVLELSQLFAEEQD